LCCLLAGSQIFGKSYLFFIEEGPIGGGVIADLQINLAALEDYRHYLFWNLRSPLTSQLTFENWHATMQSNA
jgi:hypothetical protein